ncbi:MAG: EAL domain-containing protein [Rhodocyclaceae bacterium]|nr:EAL domain-containing protein [Rhodocyclaceae bacterium]MBK9310882.1 EAL domain-containing protein [Rhodocyclaceae bacterium]
MSDIPPLSLWSRLSFGARLMLGAALVLAAATAILVVTATIRDALSMNGELERQLQSELSSQAVAVAVFARAGDQDGLAGALKARAGQVSIQRLIWRGVDGLVVDAVAPVAISAVPAWFSSAAGVVAPMASRPVVVDGGELGSVTVMMSTVAGIDRLWSAFLSNLNLLALAVGLEFLGIMLILRYGLRPLGALMEGARRFGGGNLTARIPSTGGPEMRQTIAAFNGMADNLDRMMTEIQRSSDELRIAATAFESEEPMLVTDADQAMLRVNRAFIGTTGYQPDEVLGQTPRVLLSGHHDDEAYRQIWLAVGNDKFWQGELWYRHKQGRIYPVWQTISAVVAPDGHISHYVVAFSDISQRKEAEEQIRNLAFFDPLTQLPNRRLLIDRLGLALAATTRYRKHGALLFLDLDYFKNLNDTLGHEAGDQMLVEVAGRLKSCVREGDTVARLGGDEFVVMLEDLSQDEAEAATQAELVAKKILELGTQPYRLRGREHHSTFSIGIGLFNAEHLGADELLRRADVAMYQAKTNGRNALCFFDPQMQEALLERASMQNDLRRVVEREELVLHYQPQFDEHRRVVGAEALLRWQHPVRGTVAPADFIPLAEETGLILPIGTWVLDTACRKLREWEKLPAMRHLVLAVNVSAKQFHQPDFVAVVRRILDETGVNPRRLKLELTESVVINDMADAVEKMKTLKSLGIAFSMDDFGTGYSSLLYLRRLPLDQLKIDRSFISEIESNAGDAAIVQTIIGMARSLGLDVIAEGVEKEGQHQFLKLNHCPEYQGYLFGQPVPAAIFEATFKT